MGNERTERVRVRRHRGKKKKRKVSAPRLFRPHGLVPPGMAEHSVKILHFRINHSRLSAKRKTHTHSHINKFTQHVSGNVLCLCPARQPQQCVCVRGLL